MLWNQCEQLSYALDLLWIERRRRCTALLTISFGPDVQKPHVVLQEIRFIDRNRKIVNKLCLVVCRAVAQPPPPPPGGNIAEVWQGQVQQLAVDCLFGTSLR